ncbi:MAG: 2'-5' RNA ligase family protein [Niabella sp.]|nr:2'-5' RNA ligase family protein [Niabella sp.]
MEIGTAAAYLLLLEPGEELSGRIRQEKQLFYDKCKAEEAIRGKPHITLVSYTQYEGAEERILKKFRNTAVAWSPFCVELMNYGSFPSHTIYINVVSRTGIQQLVKSIRTEMQALLKLDNDNKPHFILEPHITLARRLKPWQYESGWLEYSNKNFRGKFIAAQMTLLKKTEPDDPYQVVERFEFKGTPVLARQTALF